jgi:hypothetical protein
VVNLSNSGQIDVGFRPFTGKLTVFGNGQYHKLGSYDLGFAECSDAVRPLAESFLAMCVAEALGIDSDSK